MTPAYVTLKDQVYIVTGGARGLGLAIARSICARGGRVAIFARDSGALREAAAELGGGALAVPLNIVDRAAFAAGIERTVQHFGRLDGLINNAGATIVSRIEMLTEEALRQMTDVNFVAVVQACQLVIPHLRRNGGGRIINVTSASARHREEFPYLSIYAATKAATERFSVDLRDEVKADKIAVTCFSPGAIYTGAGKEADPVELEAGLEAWLKLYGPECDGIMMPEPVAEAIAQCLELPAGMAYDYLGLRPNVPTPKALRTYDE